MSIIKGFVSAEALTTSSAILERTAYVAETFSFARQLVVYSREAAELSRKLYTQLTGTDIDPVSPLIPYHLNLVGEISIFDSVFEVESLDTNATIEFRKDILVDHPSTLNEYRTNDSLRAQLIKQYPDRKTLIYGILSGIEIIDFTDLQEGEILFYPKNLIGENEYSLIDRLQSEIYRYRDRWYNPGYTFGNDLYYAGYLGTLYSRIPSWVLNIREEFINTLQACEFHCRQKLASNGLLDKYYNALSHRQRMFLYLNLEYLQKNQGSNKVLDLLVKGLYDPANLPLVGFYLTLTNVNNAVPSVDESVEESTGLIGSYVKDVYTVNRGGENDFLPRSVYYGLEDTILDNGRIFSPEKDRKSLLNQMGKTKTSLLVSQLTSSNSKVRYSEDEYFLDHLAANRLTNYAIDITFVEPVYGGTHVLTTDQAWHLLYWGLNKLNGSIFDVFPSTYSSINITSDFTSYPPNNVTIFEQPVLDEIYALHYVMANQVTTVGFHAAVSLMYERFKEVELILDNLKPGEEGVDKFYHLYWVSKGYPFAGAGMTLADYYLQEGITVPPDALLERESVAALFTAATGRTVNYENTQLIQLQAVNAVTSTFLPYDVDIIEEAVDIPEVNLRADYGSVSGTQGVGNFVGEIYSEDFAELIVSIAGSMDLTPETDDFFSINDSLVIQRVPITGTPAYSVFKYSGGLTPEYFNLQPDTTIIWEQVYGVPVTFTSPLDEVGIEFNTVDLDRKTFKVCTNLGTYAEECTLIDFYHYPIDTITLDGDEAYAAINPDYPGIRFFSVKSTHGMMPVDSTLPGYDQILRFSNTLVKMTGGLDDYSEVEIFSNITDEADISIQTITLQEEIGGTWITQFIYDGDTNKLLAPGDTPNNRKLIFHLKRYGYEYFLELLIPNEASPGISEGIVLSDSPPATSARMNTLISSITALSYEDYVTLSAAEEAYAADTNTIIQSLVSLAFEDTTNININPAYGITGLETSIQSALAVT